MESPIWLAVKRREGLVQDIHGSNRAEALFSSSTYGHVLHFYDEMRGLGTDLINAGDKKKGKEET